MGQERVNWDMPYIMSHFNPEVLYLGASKIYKNDGGHQNPYWQSISPDLTDSNIYGGSFHNISCLAESPFNPNHLFVGTSDGNVWRTLDAGQTWEDLSAGMPDRYVTSIFHSAQDSQRIFLSYSGHKYNDPYPHIFRSDNHGDTWVDIAGNLPQMPVRSIITHNNNDSLLFIASQGGVYGSLDAGQSWHRMGTNMPIIPVFDIEHHKEKNEIIAATFARSLMTYSLGSLGEIDTTPPAAFINKDEPIKLTVYPTIFNNQLIVNCPVTEIKISIHTLSGQLVQKNTVLKGSKQLDLSHLNSGIYLLSYIYKKKKYSHKIIKE